MRKLPNPLLWFEDDPQKPVHRINKNQNVYTLDEFATNPDLKKYHAAYDKYVKHWHGFNFKRAHRAASDEELKEARVDMLKLIN